MTRPVYLIDASIYIFQAHFSPHTVVFSAQGDDQSAFMGFARFLLRFLRRTRPASVGVAFDESLFCGFRHQLYPDYKSNRVLPDENLERQLKACAALCDVLGIAGWASETYEADDIIGTLAARLRDSPAHQGPVSIVSRDKDLAQLLHGPDDVLWDFQRDLMRNREAIETQYGIRPEQFPCFLGLTGDSVDCIPGVPGVGPVAATALLKHFQAMPALYERLDEVGGLGFRGAKRMAEKLTTFREQAELSRELATIVEVDANSSEAFARVEPCGLRWETVDEQALQSLLRQEQVDDNEQRRLAAMLEAVMQSPETMSKPS